MSGNVWARLSSRDPWHLLVGDTWRVEVEAACGERFRAPDVYHCTAEAGTSARPVIGTTCDACSCAMEDAADVA